MTDKINLYINSRYRNKDETTSYLKCIIPSGLIKSYGKDYLTLSITSFYCLTTFYQMDETNNEFSLIFGPGHCGRATDPSRVGLNRG